MRIREWIPGYWKRRCLLIIAAAHKRRRHFWQRMANMERGWRARFKVERECIDREEAKLQEALKRLVTIEGRRDSGKQTFQILTTLGMHELFAYTSAGCHDQDRQYLQRLVAHRVAEHVAKMLVQMDLSKMQEVQWPSEPRMYPHGFSCKCVLCLH